MKASACIPMIKKDYTLEEVFAKVKAAKADAVEYWDFNGFDSKLIKKLSEDYELPVSCHSTSFSILNDLNEQDKYIEELKLSIENAVYVGTKRLITLVGQDIEGVSSEVQHNAIVSGLMRAKPLLEDAGVTLMIEPLNPIVDHIGYYLGSSIEAFQIVEKVNSPNVKILYDIYHQQITEGSLTDNIINNIDKIAHFHTAGVPGRRELFEGEINYPYLFKRISQTDYDGYIGLEYSPTDNDFSPSLEEAVRVIHSI